MRIISVLLSNLVVVVTLILGIVNLINKAKQSNLSKKERKEDQRDSVDYNRTLRTLWHNTEEAAGQERSLKNTKKSKDQKILTRVQRPADELQNSMRKQEPLQQTVAEDPMERIVSEYEKTINPIQQTIHDIPKTAQQSRARRRRTRLQKAIVYQEVIGKPKAIR